MKYLFAAILALGTVASFSAAEAARMRPGLASWSLRRLPTQSPGSCGRPARRGAGPVVVVRPGRVCPYGTVWRYGRCRAY